MEITLYYGVIRIFVSFDPIKDTDFERCGLNHARRTLRKHASAVLYLTLSTCKEKEREERKMEKEKECLYKIAKRSCSRKPYR